MRIIHRNFDWTHPRNMPAASLGSRGKDEQAPSTPWERHAHRKRIICVRTALYYVIQWPPKSLEQKTQHICGRRDEEYLKILYPRTQNPPIIKSVDRGVTRMDSRLGESLLNGVSLNCTPNLGFSTNCRLYVGQSLPMTSPQEAPGLHLSASCNVWFGELA